MSYLPWDFRALGLCAAGLPAYWAGDQPRLHQAPPPSPPARQRARPGRCRRAWREIGKCFCARRRQLQFLRAAVGPAGTLKPSSAAPRPGAAKAARALTPARLPLRAQPAGRRARRGPGRGDVSANARVSKARRLRSPTHSPGPILLHPDPCSTPILIIVPPSGRVWGFPAGMLSPGPPEAGGARSRGSLWAHRSVSQACWASEPGRAGLLGPGPIPA